MEYNYYCINILLKIPSGIERVLLSVCVGRDSISSFNFGLEKSKIISESLETKGHCLIMSFNMAKPESR